MSFHMSLDLIQAARQSLKGRLMVTPTLRFSPVRPTLWLKAENMQFTGSFKARGALNKVLSLTTAEMAHGLITASAGNHALALAWAARRAGCACTVVMPSYVASGRIRAVEEQGATVLRAPTMQEVFPLMEQVRRERGLTLVHPFDDPLVMAGQGTVGLELLEQVADLDLVVVGIGGGGLIGGIATAVKALRPATRVVGVEPVGAPTMFSSRQAGRASSLSSIDTIADGLSAPYVSETTFELAGRLVDDIVLVTDDEIRAALQVLLTETKVVVEPAGAAAVAAILSGKVPIRPLETVAAVLSGGNIDLARLKSLL
jgi:threonine dehydratase